MLTMKPTIPTTLIDKEISVRKPPTLVIIDIQPEFPTASNRELLDNILAEIKKQKQLDGGIILVEYDRAGKTNPEIVKAIGKYRYFLKAIKYRDDGSDKILEELRYTKSKKFNRRNFNLCGVNTTACVYATGKGLILKKNRVTLLLYACNDFRDEHITRDTIKYGVMNQKNFKFAA
jgi:nicotinamidase-related amidase